MKMMMVAALAMLGIAGLSACEKAGEDIDTAIEKVGDGKADPKDGAFEKAGEAVDHALGTERKDAADSIGDAIDGDKSTKPN
jgi:hypothetical protein